MSERTDRRGVQNVSRPDRTTVRGTRRSAEQPAATRTVSSMAVRTTRIGCPPVAVTTPGTTTSPPRPSLGGGPSSPPPRGLRSRVPRRCEGRRQGVGQDTGQQQRLKDQTVRRRHRPECGVDAESYQHGVGEGADAQPCPEQEPQKQDSDASQDRPSAGLLSRSKRMTSILVTSDGNPPTTGSTDGNVGARGPQFAARPAQLKGELRHRPRNLPKIRGLRRRLHLRSALTPPA